MLECIEMIVMGTPADIQMAGFLCKSSLIIISIMFAGFMERNLRPFLHGKPKLIFTGR